MASAMIVNMNGTFNGVRLRRIISHTIYGQQYSFRCEFSPKFNDVLKMNSDALLILSNEIVEGRIAGFRVDEDGAEITIETVQLL
jgi:hypothetical protein